MISSRNTEKISNLPTKMSNYQAPVQHETVHYVAMTESNLKKVTNTLRKANKAYYKKAKESRKKTGSTTELKLDNYIDIKSYYDDRGVQRFFAEQMDENDEYYTSTLIRDLKTPTTFDSASLFSADSIARAFGSQVSLTPPQGTNVTYAQGSFQNPHPVSVNCETPVQSPFAAMNVSGVPSQQVQSPFSQQVVMGYPQQ